MSVLSYLCLPICDRCADGQVLPIRSELDDRCAFCVKAPGRDAALAFALGSPVAKQRLVPTAMPLRELRSSRRMVSGVGNVSASEVCAGFSHARSEAAKPKALR